MSLLAALLLLVVRIQDPAATDATIVKLIDQLSADFLDEREQARKELERLGKPAERRLIEALNRPDSRVRRAGLELLIGLKSSAALPRAGELFQNDEDPEVRETAFRLFQAVGKEAEDGLIAALSNPSSEIRRRAIASLAEFKSEKCIPRLAVLYDREPEKAVKEAAYRCILAAGPSAEPVLLLWLINRDPIVRKDALQALRGSTSAMVLEDVIKLFATETEDAPLQQAYQFLAKSGLKAEAAFLGGLKSPRMPTRLASIEGLRQIKSGKGLPLISEMFLGEVPPDLRAAAAEYLKAQGAAAEETLQRALQGASRPSLLLALQILGELGSEKALPRIAELFRDDKNREVHEKAFEFLRRMGIRAESELLGALADEDKDIRVQAIVALGDARSERAIPRLIEFLNQLDIRIREASEAALASIGPKALEAVAVAVADGRLKKSAADEIGAQYSRGEVERLLEAQIGEDGATGFYEGQFRDLEAFGKARAVPVLIRIVRDPVYSSLRASARERDRRYSERMKELAVMALGELGGAEALEALRALREASAGQPPVERIQEETLVALYRLGDPKALEGYLQDRRARADAAMKGDAEEKAVGCSLLFSVGLLQNRVGRRGESMETYLELIRAFEEHKLERATDSAATAMYNLACLNSLAGEKAKAVEWLGRSVKTGFRDRGWMKLDKDLDAIRGEDGYRKIITDDALFEKKTDGDPPSDR